MNHFNKKKYKGSHEMYNAHSYLVTDKIQTYKKIPVLVESGMFWFTSLYRTVYIQNIMKHK